MNAWDRLAESRIVEALREGQFDDLPGLGQPIPNLDEGWDETRWLREKLKAEDFRAMPPAWAIRQWAREESAKLLAIDDESALRRRIEPSTPNSSAGCGALSGVRRSMSLRSTLTRFSRDAAP